MEDDVKTLMQQMKVLQHKYDTLLMSVHFILDNVTLNTDEEPEN